MSEYFSGMHVYACDDYYYTSGAGVRARCRESDLFSFYRFARWRLACSVKIVYNVRIVTFLSLLIGGIGHYNEIGDAFEVVLGMYERFFDKREDLKS